MSSNLSSREEEMWNWANQGRGSAKHRGKGRIMKPSEEKG